MGNKYSKYKIFHFKEKIDSLPQGVDSILPPVHIRIKPTNVCNHSCSYCAYRKESLQLGKDMDVRSFIPKDKMMEIVEDIIDMDVKAVTFSGGGDPFCYPYLLEVCEKLALSSVKFAALTNGSLLNGAIAEFFAYQAEWLRISIDGWDDKSYSEYRKAQPGEFDKVIANISNFKKFLGKCLLGVSVIIDANNAEHIYELLGRLKSAGADTVKISPCIISNSAEENNEYHENLISRVKEQIEMSKNSYESEAFEIYDSYHLQLESFEKNYKWCPYLQILPVIGADLNVYSCQDKAYNFDSGQLGAIKEGSFKEFWYSSKANFFEIDPSRDCCHHCVANSKNEVIHDYLDTDKDHLSFVQRRNRYRRNGMKRRFSGMEYLSWGRKCRSLKKRSRLIA